MYTCLWRCTKHRDTLWSPQTAMRLIHTVPKRVCECVCVCVCLTRWKLSVTKRGHVVLTLVLRAQIRPPRCTPPSLFLAIFHALCALALLARPLPSVSSCLPLSSLILFFSLSLSLSLFSLVSNWGRFWNQENRSNKRCAAVRSCI